MINEIKSVIEKHKEYIPIKVMAELLAVIEQECEWKPVKWLGFPLSERVTSCGYSHRYNSITDRYCRHCGKRIKMMEVE